MASETKRLAALDYGTITSRLLVADVDANSITPCLKLSTITHLGEDLAATGMISASAAKRVITASQDFLAAINGFGDTFETSESNNYRAIEQVKAIATSALRDASNSNQIVSALAEIGIELEVVSGEHEAELSFAGTLSGFDIGSVAAKTALVIDIGGGSTELVFGTIAEPGAAAEIYRSASFDLGGRRITDSCLTSDPPTEAEIAEARLLVNNVLKTWLSETSASGLHADMVIAVAGTPTSLVAIRDRLEIYDSSHVHGQIITIKQLETVLDMLAALPLSERKSVIGLEPARAEVIIGGLIILHELFGLLGIDELTVSETDILQGVLLESYRELS